MNTFHYDFIIIGSGLAGLNAALYASRFGKAALITKSKLDVSSTYWAQGGIAAAVADDDSTEYHLEDTLTAGAGLCRREVVEILVNEGPDRIKDLIDLGMKFDEKRGKLELGLEGNHSKRRVLHAGGDSTGREIIHFLAGKVAENNNIDIFENTHAFDLIAEDDSCAGVHVYNWKIKENQVFLGKGTIIAAGGATGIYSRTTNPHSSTGDGVFLAYNSGAEIANMELIQFHPSSLVTGKEETFLISEAVRGEGAYLLNSKNERFMLEIDSRGELAPRDIVAYEMNRQLSIPGNVVYLSLKHLDPDKIRNRFSNIYNQVKKYGLRLCSDLIPVAPAAHYMIGGVKTGLSGETNIQGLYACGETACTGVHGANRLASNSLLECLVFSKRAVDHSIAGPVSDSGIVNRSALIDYHVNNGKSKIFLGQRNKIAEVLSEHVGVARNESGLKKALNLFKLQRKKFDFDKREYHSKRFLSLLTVAELITESALLRKESRGGHRRTDYVNQEKRFLTDITRSRKSEYKFEKINETQNGIN